MFSGITMIIFKPKTAQHIASPTPVLPLVGSIITVSLFILPSFIAQLIIEYDALSLTELDGL